MELLKVDIKDKSFDRTVFINVNIIFEQNKIYGLVGLNGSGKTTLINLILGLDKNYTGTIEYLSIDIKNDIFFISSEFYIPEYLTGYEYAKYLHELKDKQFDETLFRQLCELFDIHNDTSKLISTYSYGMKKKIQFITGMLLDCKLYIFDELTSGLDIETILLIEYFLSLKKASYIISSHEIDFIQKICDKVLLINNNTISFIEDLNNVRNELIILSKVEDKYEKIKNII